MSLPFFAIPFSFEFHFREIWPSSLSLQKHFWQGLTSVTKVKVLILIEHEYFWSLDNYDHTLKNVKLINFRRHRCKHRASTAGSTSSAMTIEAAAKSEMTASRSEERKMSSTMQYSSSSTSEKKATMAASSSRRSMSSERVVEAKSLSANLLALTGSKQAQSESAAVTSSTSIAKVKIRLLWYSNTKRYLFFFFFFFSFLFFCKTRPRLLLTQK